MQESQLQIFSPGRKGSLKDRGPTERRQVLGAIKIEMVLEGQRGGLILVYLELDLLQAAIDQFIEDAIEMDLLDVFLGLHEKGLGLLHLPLHVRHVLLQPLQLPSIFLRDLQQLHELLAMIDRYLLHQFLRLIFQLDQLGLLLY